MSIDYKDMPLSNAATPIVFAIPRWWLCPHVCQVSHGPACKEDSYELKNRNGPKCLANTFEKLSDHNELKVALLIISIPTGSILLAERVQSNAIPTTNYEENSGSLPSVSFEQLPGMPVKQASLC